ncbi:nuclease-related domain-containing protein [Modestobacter sp. DSM 44400]|uniref:nuclease-related domain-containing protein n=1 Tax=Modestobacter sp. DSM 44400 TaxID=1550230 RepID=UPI001C31E2F2|nr:nuclease-related domain-containing protein [Modestobacter sp. DSM 44400]
MTEDQSRPWLLPESTTDQPAAVSVAEASVSYGFDLAAHRPGQLVREQAMAAREAAPVRSVLARLLGVHTEERAWRIGADGEEMVAAAVQKLIRRDPLWRIVHAIPVGPRGSDIDHLVIGPGGVFTLNAKHHPGARIWVGGGTFIVNGVRQPYIRNSRHEAARASRLLSSARGAPVDVTGVVVPVNAKAVTIKTPSADVHVVARRRLRHWLRSREQVLDDEMIDLVYAHARDSSTWQ